MPAIEPATQAQRARAVDHLVLPVESLATARQRLTQLGFTVAPDGNHPFGTSNCCVFLGDGTFLEPLAVANANVVAEAIAAGNVFVTRDRNYRAHHPGDGFSAVVLASGNADADHSRFVETAISAGPLLQFTRPFTDSTGKSDVASFRLAFAVDQASPDPYFFSSQRVHSPHVDRAALQRHCNGVVRIKQIVLGADNPSAHLHFLTSFFGVPPVQQTDGSNRLVLANATVVVARDSWLENRYAIGGDRPGDGLRPRCIVFGTANVDALRGLFDAEAIDYQQADDRFVVQTAAGQGAVFIFEVNE